MPHAKIIRFPKAARRRPVPPPPPAAGRHAVCRHPGRSSAGYELLRAATLLGAFVYLTFPAARHDSLYAALLAIVWGLYLILPLLLRVRVLGPLLAPAGRVLGWAGFAAFFGFVYWLILSHG
jgi:hypothetical protein